ncbi:MAG: Bcr/CflA family drug resistance efflux transporter [Methylophaga sp.]|nr:MAG: Bcr/CflA family drug resistance efflux transporter [Methylophaga sp.]
MSNPAQKTSRFWIIAIMSLLSMTGPFAIDTYLPAFPAIEAEFGISRALLSQSLGFYLAAFAVATLFWGPITDRFGRKTAIISGMSIYLLASLGCALADNYNHFLLFRTIQGAAAAGGIVASRALIRDMFDSKHAQQVMSYVVMFFALAPAIAPILGAWLHEAYGWRSIFYFLALFCAVVIGLILTLVHETLAIDKRQSLHPVAILSVYLKMLSNFRLQALVLANGACFGGFFLFIASSPTILFDFLGLAEKDYWMQFTPMVAGLIIGSFISSKISHSYSAKKTITTALTIMMVATILNLLQAYFLPISIVGFVFPLFLYALGMGMAMPTFAIMALDCFPENKGSASAVQSSALMMANALVASIIVPVFDSSLISLVVVQFVFISAAVLLWLGRNI